MSITEQNKSEFDGIEKRDEIADTSSKELRPSREAIQSIQNSQDATREKEWVDIGIQDVPVSEIDLSDMEHIHGSSDFYKVSYDEMVEGLRKLEQEVKPAVQKGVDGGYFSKLDREKGLSYREGYRQVFDVFYGSTAISLIKDGEKYSVENGYHRIKIANDLGIGSLPAKVKEKRMEQG